MGTGTEILFMLVLTLLVLGPKQLHMLLGHVAWVKAKVQDASRDFTSLLDAELHAPPLESKNDSLHESSENQ